MITSRVYDVELEHEKSSWRAISVLANSITAAELLALKYIEKEYGAGYFVKEIRASSKIAIMECP